MPLFQENPLRSAVVATAAVALGHFVTRFLVSPGASQLLQTSVAIIAIAALVGMIVMHHRQEGQLLTQEQEEYILIGGLALTWVAPFAGGVWKIHVELPDQYPYKSPSIGFMNKIFHPNIDELSGSVCLDVINTTWSPMFDMINIFEVFLPQLLRYPNPNDPLNGEAAALLMRHPKEYEAKVREYVQRYATKEAADAAGGKDDEDEDEEMSDIGSISDDD
ncbi:hypothetical protein H1R20_g5386, partial [Candolleomyces eurysporus]